MFVKCNLNLFGKYTVINSKQESYKLLQKNSQSEYLILHITAIKAILFPKDMLQNAAWIQCTHSCFYSNYRLIRLIKTLFYCTTHQLFVYSHFY